MSKARLLFMDQNWQRYSPPLHPSLALLAPPALTGFGENDNFRLTEKSRAELLPPALPLFGTVDGYTLKGFASPID